MNKKYGFFLNGKLVDSTYALNLEAAKSNMVHDEKHEIIDTSALCAGTVDANAIAIDSKDYNQ